MQIDFPLLWPAFNPRLVHVAIALDKAALRQNFSENFGLSCQFSFHKASVSLVYHPGRQN
jgi:hypothetical protein